MSVKKEANGRRSLPVEFEVPGTPEEIWQAIATGPYFVLDDASGVGGSRRKARGLKLKFGPGFGCLCC